MVKGKLVLAVMGNRAAIAYPNFGAGPLLALTTVALCIKEFEIGWQCTLVALFVTSGCNAVPDAATRCVAMATDRDPYSTRLLRVKFRKDVTA